MQHRRIGYGSRFPGQEKEKKATATKKPAKKNKIVDKIVPEAQEAPAKE